MQQAITKENRYVVLKRSDIEKYLSQRHQNDLYSFIDTLECNRAAEGKSRISGVFIDDRWGKSDKAWGIIEEVINERAAY